MVMVAVTDNYSSVFGHNFDFKTDALQGKTKVDVSFLMSLFRITFNTCLFSISMEVCSMMLFSTALCHLLTAIKKFDVH